MVFRFAVVALSLPCVGHMQGLSAWQFFAGTEHDDGEKFDAHAVKLYAVKLVWMAYAASYAVLVADGVLMGWRIETELSLTIDKVATMLTLVLYLTTTVTADEDSYEHYTSNAEYT